MTCVPGEALRFDNPECFDHNPTASYYIFRTAMRRFVRPTQDDVFLDYGSGLGRVLLMAATNPFRRVIGVECSAELNSAAESIINRVKSDLKCRDIRLVTADAAEYELPADVSVVYFFNPFGGNLLKKVVQNIRDSLARSPRSLRIVYHAPGKFEKIVEGCQWLSKTGEVVIPEVSSLRTVVYESRIDFLAAE
jgi:precorrin-6B methylase 2